MGVFTSIKALCHAGLAAWHLYLPKKMVEARGIEPLSEGAPARTSTSVDPVLDFAPESSLGSGSIKGYPACFLILHTGDEGL